MLEIKKISKIYETEGFKQKALDGVSVNFRECEFAAILGPSGSGKTTFLNIIGGLDHYTSGDLVVNEISTKKFKDSDWDSYRNHRIGFVFQSYNLISHQTILANVKLALTLSGISKKEANERAKKALKDVGLEKHIHKRPSQLSGGQMQRVAIARALVNNPDILLADEPTGALDSETSIQIMNLLKKIAKNKLVIMVTHNPDLAEEYATRIINLKDGKITTDTNPYNGKVNTKEDTNLKKEKTKKTSMSFFTALALSFNNLMTKKGRTILVAFAGSIGIIGISLILAVSTGFKNYVDSIQEDTLTSYPLTITEQAADITSLLLSMTSSDGKDKIDGVVKEQQQLTSMLANVSKNDLRNFKKYIEDNYKEIVNDISSIKYSYSVDPMIYTIDAGKKLSKINPSNLFSSMYGSSAMMSSYSSMASVFSQMIDDKETLKEQYDILAGKLPDKYDEMLLVLPDKGAMPDFLVYSLGLRETDQLTEIITKIMSGESVDLNTEAKTFTYEELMKIELKLIMPSDTYKYNKKYDVYEDMTDDEKFMNNLYKNATQLKIVGIVTAKPGKSATALNPGVAYTSKLIDYIINYAKDSEIVKKQLEKPKIDIFSGKKFDSKKNDFDLEFSDLVKIDSKKLESAFNVKINQYDLQNKTEGYMTEINNSITTDINPAKNLFLNNLTTLANGLFDGIDDKISLSEVQEYTKNYLETDSVKKIFSSMEKQYVVPASTFKLTYTGLLTSMLQIYINSYYAIDQSLTEDVTNPVAIVLPEIKDEVIKTFTSNAAIIGTAETLGKAMTEALMKKTILTKVGELTSTLTSSFASAFSVDEDKMASAFSLNFTEEELMRVFSAMMNDTDANAKTNLISLGYQDKEEPTFISFYFNSFDGKEHFLKFIDAYNDTMKKIGEDDKVINYADTTGILMSSVKTIVDAVSYVLIAFVSISLVVSSIMIGIITYISVYERTKEIGILRSIGASKRNVSSIFNAETFIIGFLSGLIGIGVSYSLIPIINNILHKFTGDIPLNAALNIDKAGLLIILSVILTLIGGLIPANSAAKRDPVEALRSD